MNLKLVTPPANEPVSLSEAKTHLRIDNTDTEEDTVLESLITVAREYCENYQNRAYMDQTWQLTFDYYPDMPMSLPKPPLKSVTSIKFIDANGNETTFDSSNYIVDSDSGRIALKTSWPNIDLQPIAGVKIQFTAGGNTVPERIKQAILLLVGHWHENREATTDINNKEVEFAVKALLWQDRVVSI